MNYYKITKENEIHYGVRYQDGIVTDPLPFEPLGDCLPGGLYFAREDILAFLEYGPWIRKVEPVGHIYINPCYLNCPRKFKAHALNCGERREITAEVVQGLLDEGANPHITNDFPLKFFARCGKTDIVKILLKYCDPVANGSEPLRMAALNGYIETVKLLLPLSDPQACNNSALRNAARKGHAEIVKLLIPVSNPKDCDNSALRYAVEYDRPDIVKLLLPVSDLTAAEAKDFENTNKKSSWVNKEISDLFEDYIKQHAI